jgi:hypothetical protein
MRPILMTLLAVAAVQLHCHGRAAKGRIVLPAITTSPGFCPLGQAKKGNG